MRTPLTHLVLALALTHVLSPALGVACCLAQQAAVEAAAGQTTQGASKSANGELASTQTGLAGGAPGPALAGERHSLYRLRKSDIVELDFTFSPEFNQTVSVQPDGYITLRGVPQIFAERLTVPELVEQVRAAYMNMLNDPEVAAVLKDFDKPYFTAGGEVGHPGKYELRDDITLTEAVTIAGGFTSAAKHSQVVLFRKVNDDLVESHVVNVKDMLKARKLSEDIHLRAGDFVYVPKNSISKIRQYMPVSNLSLYANPQAF
ncbi:MAG: polysaccharide biosynthesis/export family protein [Terriglobales bacterium]